MQETRKRNPLVYLTPCDLPGGNPASHCGWCQLRTGRGRSIVAAEQSVGEQCCVLVTTVW
jgi:hypothetical protein